MSCRVSQNAALAAAAKMWRWEKPTEKQRKAENSAANYCHHGVSGSAGDMGPWGLCASEGFSPVLYGRVGAAGPL